MTDSRSAQLAISRPRYFNFPMVLLENVFSLAFALLLGVIGLLPLAMLPLAFSLNLPPLLFTVLPVFYLVVMLLAMLMLLPVLGANPLVICLLHLSLRRQPAPDEFTVQIMLTPRPYRGLRAVLEDADDVGYLRLAPEGLTFTGDHVQLALPRSGISAITRRNVGWRMLWLAGQRITIVTDALPGYTAVEFLERQSWTVPGSRRLTRELLARFPAARQ